jgi:hypothetical protein
MEPLNYHADNSGMEQLFDEAFDIALYLEEEPGLGMDLNFAFPEHTQDSEQILVSKEATHARRKTELKEELEEAKRQLGLPEKQPLMSNLAVTHQNPGSLTLSILASNSSHPTTATSIGTPQSSVESSNTIEQPPIVSNMDPNLPGLVNLSSRKRLYVPGVPEALQSIMASKVAEAKRQKRTTSTLEQKENKRQVLENGGQCLNCRFSPSNVCHLTFLLFSTLLITKSSSPSALAMQFAFVVGTRD